MHVNRRPTATCRLTQYSSHVEVWRCRSRVLSGTGSGGASFWPENCPCIIYTVQAPLPEKYTIGVFPQKLGIERFALVPASVPLQSFSGRRGGGHMHVDRYCAPQSISCRFCTPYSRCCILSGPCDVFVRNCTICSMFNVQYKSRGSKNTPSRFAQKLDTLNFPLVPGQCLDRICTLAGAAWAPIFVCLSWGQYSGRLKSCRFENCCPCAIYMVQATLAEE